MSKKKKQKKEKEEVIISKNTKRNVKKLVIIIGISLIILLIITYFLGTEIRFIFQEEITLGLTPLEKSITVQTGQSPNITFSLSLDTSHFCSTKCNYVLKDISENKILQNQTTFNTKSNKITYTLPIPNKGEGQKIFNYKITCNNIRSDFCSTDEEKYFKTALITVNYELSKEDKELKQELSSKLTSYLNKLSEVDKLKQEIKYKLNFLQNTKEKRTIQEKINLINIKPNAEFLTLWNKKEYTQLNNIFSPNTPNIADLKKEIDSTISIYNSNLDLLNNIIKQKEKIKEQYIILKRDNSNVTKFNNLKKELETTYNSLDSIYSYTKFNEHILELNQYKKNLQTNANLIIQNITNDAKNNTQIISKILKLNLTLSNDINGLCINLNNLTKETIKNNIQSKKIIEEKYNNTNKTKLYKDIKLYVESLITGKEFKPKYPELNISNFSEIKIINTSNIINPFYENQCINTKIYNYSFDIKNKSNKIIIPKKIFNSTINIKLNPNNPQCCVLDNCSDCCGYNECKENYPIIFLHGHAISKENSPEQSQEAFAKIQSLMEEFGYINAGQIGKGSNEIIPNGDWGRFDAPITVRLSYYLLTYIDLGSYEMVTQKTDKIENYAIRLNELINIVKSRTGKDKVIIIAHSMGGLVAREYEMLFGSNSIKEMILLGTPNKGIEGRVKKFCSITGSSKECQDMYNDSIFIKKLNNHKPNIPVYTISAIGCDMDGENGDGVVLARNVPLKYATNYEIKGNCSDILKSNLHTNFINPDLYPQTFQTIIQIINQ